MSIGDIELLTTIGFKVSLACEIVKDVRNTFNNKIFLRFIIFSLIS